MKNNNVYKFDNSYEMQELICDNRLGEDDYIGALQTIKYCRADSGWQKEKKLAEVYMEMQLFDLALFHWFKYLDNADEREQYYAYEGLGICYVNMGEPAFARYYFNQSLISMDDVMEFDPELFDYIRDMDDEKNPRFKLVHPPSLVDYSDVLNSSKYLIKNQRYDEALELLATVDEESPYYPYAANDMVIVHLLKEDYKKAEDTAERILAGDESNVSALSSLQSIYLQTGRRDKASDIADRLYRSKTDDLDELYKTASVLCEQDKPFQALEKYKLIEKQAPFDKDILFTMAALYHNTGRLYECVKYLGYVVDIYDDITAVYYMQKVNKSLFEGVDISNITPLPYVLRLPTEEKLSLLSAVTNILTADKKSLEAEELSDRIYSVFDWCLTSEELGDECVDALVVNALFKLKGKRNDEYIRDLLLRSDINDIAKLEIISKLCESNTRKSIGAVVCNVYKRLEFLPLDIGKKQRQKFLAAYGICFSKFAMLGDMHGEKLNCAAQVLYFVFSEEGLFKEEYSVNTVAAAIYLTSSLKDAGRSLKKLAAAFNADYEDLKQIMSFVKNYN